MKNYTPLCKTAQPPALIHVYSTVQNLEKNMCLLPSNKSKLLQLQVSTILLQSRLRFTHRSGLDHR